MDTARLSKKLSHAEASSANAAVALILTPDSPVEILFIKRSKAAFDPWSGHIALPGGRKEPYDSSILETVYREALEEVGIDLRGKAVLLGSLSPLTPGNAPSITVIPYVFQLKEKPAVKNSPEIETYFWAPLQALEKVFVKAELRENTEQPRPAYLYKERVIWGMTARILDEFFQLIG